MKKKSTDPGLPFRVSLTPYLNTRPFLAGLENYYSKDEILISRETPKLCGKNFFRGKSDIALIPSTLLPQVTEAKIFSPYCIAADGRVRSVLLVSDCPLRKIGTVYSDPNSSTSNMLARILARNFWRISPEFKSANRMAFRKNSREGKVIIGDAALRAGEHYAYCYDLAFEWKKWTGLPFVFAVWACCPGKFSFRFLARFNSALRAGISSVPLHLKHWASEYGIKRLEIKQYLTNCVRFSYGAKEKEALAYFIRCIRSA